MELHFYKYQGTGNDFIMVDNRHSVVSKNDTKLVQRLCDRKFGIGSDGLILLNPAQESPEDFRMVYFNADGKESSMCGNGGRCLVAFARFLKLIKDSAIFRAIDGLHEASFEGDLVRLRMVNVAHTEEKGEACFLDSGSPHHVIFGEDVASLDIRDQGRKIRYGAEYNSKGGTNVNFVEVLGPDHLKVRTYERGVEDETLSCGTGVTAVALAAYSTGRIKSTEVRLETPGGQLKVSFVPSQGGFKNIWLTGPAVQVFKGSIRC